MKKEASMTTSVKNRRRRSRGQAMVEYSFINFVLVILLCLTTTVRVLPGSGGTPLKRNLIEYFLEAYQVYYDSYYFVLNLPFP
jgi:hypothetical protein